MSLLDDLKREAQECQAADTADQEAIRREAGYQERIRPAMRDILHYLSELTDQLKALGLDVRQDCGLPGFGLVKRLRQGAMWSTPTVPGTREPSVCVSAVPMTGNGRMR